MRLHNYLTLALMAIFSAALPGNAEEKAKKTPVPKALNFKMKSIDGKEIDRSKYQGKVVLIVNVASQ